MTLMRIYIFDNATDDDEQQQQQKIVFYVPNNGCACRFI